jgi:polysaccharide export outer membrane protein
MVLARSLSQMKKTTVEAAVILPILTSIPGGDAQRGFAPNFGVERGRFDMPGIITRRSLGMFYVAAMLGILANGCQVIRPEPVPDIPRELATVSQPPYVIEPPDILVIDAIRLIPKPPYRVEPLDALAIRVTPTPEDQPISGIYSVEPEGTINLGFSYGSVRLARLTLEEAKEAIVSHLKGKGLKPGFEVTVAVAESRAMQLIRGPHLVRVDGTVSLGVYGAVFVDNMTIPEARAAIEEHLAQFLVDPEVSLDVSGYNSKVFYIVSDSAGFGEQVTRLPMTGKTTVLDAIGQVNGLSPVASKCRIWVARPAPCGSGAEMTLAVDWNGIVRRGETATNYQILPGDRIYVNSDPLVTIDTYVARILAPVERTFGAILLVNTTLENLRRPGGTGGVNNR